MDAEVLLALTFVLKIAKRPPHALPAATYVYGRRYSVFRQHALTSSCCLWVREYSKEVHCKVTVELSVLMLNEKSLKGFIPKQIRKKVYKNGEGVVNDRLRLECMQRAWRKSLSNPSSGLCLGSLQHLLCHDAHVCFSWK